MDVSSKKMEGEAIFIKATEESTARMDELSGVDGKGGGITPGLEDDFSDLDDRIKEARSIYLTDQELRPRPNHGRRLRCHPNPHFS